MARGRLARANNQTVGMKRRASLKGVSVASGWGFDLEPSKDYKRFGYLLEEKDPRKEEEDRRKNERVKFEKDLAIRIWEHLDDADVQMDLHDLYNNPEMQK
jgi:hypothetical protein